MNASLIHPVAKKMMEADGIYIVGTDGNSLTASVIWSINGQLIVMAVDKELDPTRFNDNAVIKHGPLKP